MACRVDAAESTLAWPPMHIPSVFELSICTTGRVAQRRPGNRREVDRDVGEEGILHGLLLLLLLLLLRAWVHHVLVRLLLKVSERLLVLLVLQDLKGLVLLDLRLDPCALPAARLRSLCVNGLTPMNWAPSLCVLADSIPR